MPEPQNPTAVWAPSAVTRWGLSTCRKMVPPASPAEDFSAAAHAAEAGTCLRVAFTSHTTSDPLVLACRLLRPWACPAARLVPFSSLSDRAAMLPVSCLQQVVAMILLFLWMARRTSLTTRRLSTCEEVRFAPSEEGLARLPATLSAPTGHMLPLSLCRRSVGGRAIVGGVIVGRWPAVQTAPASRRRGRASLGHRARLG